MEDYIKKNKELWNARTDIHVASDFYDVKGFLEGRSSLTDIEMEVLGDIKGKSILHLQCHFGQDSLSMARLGANLTGVDLSDKAIDKAKELSQQLGLNAEFVCCDIYDAPKHINKQFDIVFTSFGTIGWFPDLDKWGKLINHFLRPGGRFVFAEFHPLLWMFDNDFTYVQYSYFNKDVIVEKEEGTYANKNSSINLESVSWNHPLDEVLSALLSNGLTLKTFNEYDYSPFNCFNPTEEFEKGKWRIKQLGNRIPMVYSLTAIK